MLQVDSFYTSHYNISRLFTDDSTHLISSSRTKRLCLQHSVDDGARTPEFHQQISSGTVICSNADKMTSSRPRQCLFLPKHAPFCSLWRYWCFWLNCLFPQSWIQSSTPETSCIVVSTAATPPPPPPPPPPTPSLTDVLIPVWEEIPQETISRLLRRAPRPRESVHAGWRPCTLLSYSMSCLVQIQTF